jgi:DDE superfamily endonuclease
MTPLLDALLALLDLWIKVFPQQRTFERAIRLALGQVLAPGSRTISRIIAACGLDQQDWSADYRVFSRSPWQQRRLFHPLIKQGMPYFTGRDYLNVAGDFTHLPKTGRHIPNLHCMRDPMSPAFHVNLIYGLRFVQYTMVLPLYESSQEQEEEEQATPARSIPICFDEVPVIKKPGRKAGAQEHALYKAECRKRRTSRMALESLRELRAGFDAAGAADKDLLVALDGSFCNRVFFKEVPERVELVVRCRKDAKLTSRAAPGSGRFYAPESFTPESVRIDESRPFNTGRFFHGGAWRQIRYKEAGNIYWPHGAQRRPLRLIVLAPTPYRLSPNGRTFYRQPAYILTSDLRRPASVIIQCYLDRWQIEVNHREEKSHFGAGDAQVRNQKSVPRQPAFVVAVYAMPLMAAQKAYGDKRSAHYVPLPKWRKHAKRPSCLDVVSQLRREMELAPEKLLDFASRTNVTAAATFRAAA